MGGGIPWDSLPLPKDQQHFKTIYFIIKQHHNQTRVVSKKFLTGLSDLCLWSGLMDESWMKTSLSHTYLIVNAQGVKCLHMYIASYLLSSWVMHLPAIYLATLYVSFAVCTYMSLSILNLVYTAQPIVLLIPSHIFDITTTANTGVKGKLCMALRSCLMDKLHSLLTLCPHGHCW